MKIHPEEYLILIVDDTEANVRLLSHALTKEKYNIATAHNGKDALSLVREKQPDLILLDVMMPDMSGFEVSSELKKTDHYKDIPIIFLSALTETGDKIRGFKSGGVDYITKPFHREETLARIRTHLHLRTLQSRLNERIKILREREIELSRLNKSKDDLVRMVSHDIKNPLTGMIGLVKLMRENDKIGEEERKQMFSVIEESGKKLLDLVKDMLDRESNKAASEKLALENTDLIQVAERVVTVNKAKAVVKNISLEVDTELPELYSYVDPTKLETVINNLVSNALKFTPSGGEIKIVISKNGKDTALFEVKDTGIGIPEEMIDNIFESNGRESMPGTGGESGTGLGLDIAQLYTELHDGKITVESELDKGTSFFVELPLKKSK